MLEYFSKASGFGQMRKYRPVPKLMDTEKDLEKYFLKCAACSEFFEKEIFAFLTQHVQGFEKCAVHRASIMKYCPTICQKQAHSL